MPIKPDVSSANSFITNLVTVIGRMAAYSSSCKQLCITVVSAILVLALDKGKAEAIVIGLLAVVLFFLVDAYYLSIERDFREVYTSFVDKIHAGTADEAVFVMKLPLERGHRLKGTLSALLSFSVLPFYAIIAISIIVIKIYLSSLPNTY